MGRCIHYTGVFLHQRTHLRRHSLQVVHICVYVYMCVYACICIWMRMCVYDIAWHVEALLLRFSICAYVCICMRLYMCVDVCVYMCMCICMYMYICMSVNVCIYIYMRARVGVHMHSCRRILFICTVQSLYYMRVHHRCFITPACVCVKGLVVWNSKTAYYLCANCPGVCWEEGMGGWGKLVSQEVGTMKS